MKKKQEREVKKWTERTNRKATQFKLRAAPIFKRGNEIKTKHKVKSHHAGYVCQIDHRLSFLDDVFSVCKLQKLDTEPQA